MQTLTRQPDRNQTQPDPQLEGMRAAVAYLLGPNPTIEECIRLRYLLGELAEMSGGDKAAYMALVTLAA